MQAAFIIVTIGQIPKRSELEKQVYAVDAFGLSSFMFLATLVALLWMAMSACWTTSLVQTEI